MNHFECPNQIEDAKRELKKAKKLLCSIPCPFDKGKIYEDILELQTHLQRLDSMSVHCKGNCY